MSGYELLPCGHVSREGAGHACEPLEGEVLPPLRTPAELYAQATRVDRWPEVIEGSEPDPEPERVRCPECGHTRELASTTSVAYCSGGHRGERRHGLVALRAVLP